MKWHPLRNIEIFIKKDALFIIKCNFLVGPIDVILQINIIMFLLFHICCKLDNANNW